MRSVLPIVLSLLSVVFADTLSDECKRVKSDEYKNILTVTLPCQKSNPSEYIDCKRGKCLINLNEHKGCEDVTVHAKVILDHRFRQSEIDDLLEGYHSRQGYSGINLEVKDDKYLSDFLSKWNGGDKAITLTEAQYINGLTPFKEFLEKNDLTLFVIVTDFKANITAPAKKDNFYLIVRNETGVNDFVNQHPGVSFVLEETRPIDNFVAAVSARR